MSNRVVVPARRARNRFRGFLKCLQIWALEVEATPCRLCYARFDNGTRHVRLFDLLYLKEWNGAWPVPDLRQCRPSSAWRPDASGPPQLSHSATNGIIIIAKKAMHNKLLLSLTTSSNFKATWTLRTIFLNVLIIINIIIMFNRIFCLLVFIILFSLPL